MTEQYQCQSYSDDNHVVQDCTCGNCMTPDKREVWFEKFWELVDKSENYSTLDERITAREKLEEHVTQYHQDMMSEVVEKLKTKSVIELFPDANVDFPTEKLADQVMYKEAYNDGIREAQTIIKSK